MRALGKLPAIYFRRINIRSYFRFGDISALKPCMPVLRLTLPGLLLNVAGIRLASDTANQVRIKLYRQKASQSSLRLQPGAMQQYTTWLSGSLKQELASAWEEERASVRANIQEKFKKKYGQTTT